MTHTIARMLFDAIGAVSVAQASPRLFRGSLMTSLAACIAAAPDGRSQP